MFQEAQLPAQSSEPQVLVLRFISGKYEGGEFPLLAGQEVLIGRATDADLVLVEELVSRHHATVARQAHVVRVTDLGSTNGTFINGERIKRAELVVGDRLLIGTNILKLVAVEGGRVSPASEVRSLQNIAAERQTDRGPRMRGDLEEIPVTDLVQLLANGKKTGVLLLRAAAGSGKIHFQKGQIVHAELLRLPGLSPHKAFFRVMGLTRGQFELEAAGPSEFLEPFVESTEHLVIEAMRHYDEVKRLAPDLPRQTSRFALPTPLLSALEDLEECELELVQAALNAESLRALLDSRPESDLELLQSLSRLLADGYLVERRI